MIGALGRKGDGVGDGQWEWEGCAGFLLPYNDYRRYTYADGRLIGTQYDTSASFTQSGFSIFSDFLELFDREGPYVGAGVGAIQMREIMAFDRHEDYAPADQAREEVRWHWQPALRAVLGFYSGGWVRGFRRIEFSYQAAFNLPAYASSFPTDNSPITHSMSVGFAWL